jgi:RNA polymerase I specific transcription initiation factor RRN3
MSVLETAAAAPQRVQSLKRKRNSDALPTPILRQHSEPILSNGSPKRPKISSIASSSEIRSLEKVKTLAWVQQTTLKTLEDHKTGQDDLYDKLKRKFDQKAKTTSRDYDEDGPISHEELRKWVIALTTHSHAMGRDSGALLSAMLGCRWLERDEVFLADFQRFLVSLLSAHGGYVPHVLKWLITKFANGKRVDG